MTTTADSVFTNHNSHGNWEWGDIRALALHLFDDHLYEPWCDVAPGDRSRVEEADLGAYGDIYEDLIRFNALHQSFHGTNTGGRKILGQTPHETDYLNGILSFPGRY